ncbi:MAG: MFS transporter [Victivallaceae bacterium]|jgi:MFS family permease
MQSSLPEAPAAPKAAGEVKTFHCGTLVYTQAGLVALFGFLLWGDFCCMMMQTVIPSILPLKLKALGASNVLIGVLLTSIFPIFGVFISPYLSFKSDYLRTRWGRRIPFFALSIPFVFISIMLLAFSDDISAFLYRNSSLMAMLSPASAAILVIAVFVVSFQFADVMIMSVFQYIFNDTVPVMFIGRFMGLMRIVGGVIGFLYNYFIFKYAESNSKEIFICTAFIYLIGIGMMCLFVKEGKYPPVTEKEKNNTRGWAGFKTYFRETYSCKFYWTKFIYSTTSAMAWAVGPFYVFYYKDLGLSLEYIGKAAAVGSAAAIAAAYFSSIFIDRWHPLRIMTYSSIFAVVFSAAGWVWLFVTLSPEAFFWLSMMFGGLIGAFHTTLAALASMPFNIRLQPKSRYGQFCSAESILRNGCTIAAGFLVGLFFDSLMWLFHGSGYAYRFIFVWALFWLIVSAAVIGSLYRQWHALGGDFHFHPPAPWSETGFEEMEQAPYVSIQTRWLSYALVVFRLLMLLSIVYLIPLTYWLWHIGWSFDFKWHLFAIIPVSMVIYGVWSFIERAIRADVARCLAGEKPLDGIPHHGVFLLKACALLLIFFAWTGMTIMAVRGGLQGGVMVFGIGNLITNALVIGAVLVLRRLERGYDPMLNYDGRKEEYAAVVISKPPPANNEDGAGNDDDGELPVTA